MTSPRYIIVSGYFGDGEWQPWFHKLWWCNNFKYLRSKASWLSGFWNPTLIKQPRVIIISNTTKLPAERFGEWIVLDGDLGHADDIIHGGKPYFCPGAVAVWMIGAWAAYSSLCDFIYLEQDCLVFGRWVRQMYKELGDKSAIFGRGGLHGGTSTALFLIKHHYIPQWCYDYLAEGSEDSDHRLPEKKWLRMAQRRPEDYEQFSFGFDTDRPLNFDSPVFYAQKATRQELKSMEKAGLISCDGMPKVELFSNHK